MDLKPTKLALTLYNPGLIPSILYLPFSSETVPISVPVMTILANGTGSLFTGFLTVPWMIPPCPYKFEEINKKQIIEYISFIG